MRIIYLYNKTVQEMWSLNYERRQLMNWLIKQPADSEQSKHDVHLTKRSISKEGKSPYPDYILCDNDAWDDDDTTLTEKNVKSYDSSISLPSCASGLNHIA